MDAASKPSKHGSGLGRHQHPAPPCSLQNRERAWEEQGVRARRGTVPSTGDAQRTGSPLKTDVGEMTGPVDQSRPVRRVSHRRQRIFTPEGLTLLPDKRPDFRARTGRAHPVALPPGTSTILLHAETKPRATKRNKPQVGAPNPGSPKLSGGSAPPAL